MKITPKENTHTRARENDLFLEIMENGGANSNQQEQEIADTSIGLQDIKDTWLPFIALHAGLITDDREFDHFKRHQRGPSVYADFTPRMQKLVNITQAFAKKYLESGSYVAADDPHIPQTIGRALKRKLTGKPWRPSEIYLHDGEHFKFTQEMAQNVRQDDDLRDLSDDEITEAARKYDRKLGSHGDETRDPVERRLNVFKAHYLEKVLGRKLADKIRKERKNKYGHDGVNRG